MRISTTQNGQRLLETYTAQQNSINAQRARAQDGAVDAREGLVERLMPEWDLDASAGAAFEPAEALQAEALRDAQAEAAGAQAAQEEEGQSLADMLEEMRAEHQFLREELQNAREQAEAAASEYESMGKVLIIFRRIAKGDTVPVKDERKLMEYDMKLYNMAKQLGAVAENEDPKRHKSLYEDEEEAAAAEGGAAEQASAPAAEAAPAPAVEAATPAEG